MEKEFVPYELAVKLKELGFDEPCIMQWHYTNDLLFCVDVRNYPKYKTNLESKSDSLGDCISAPTFSQAFRFLRDRYNLMPLVDRSYMNLYEFRVVEKGWGYTASTYEEAELACLIKLIEIVEQQNQK